MGWKDNLEAQGRGAAQTLTGGWNDEIVAKLIQAMPVGNDTGIPRTYAGGQYEQYRDQQRADEADSQRKAPANFATGQILGAAPGAVATIAAGGLPAVGLGVASGANAGAGTSTKTGKELAKDAVRGAALGGGLAATGGAAQAAGPVMRELWRQGPPMGPALAHAGAGEAPARPIPTPETPKGPQLNFAHGESKPPTAPKPPEQVSFDLPGPKQGPRPGKYYATDDPSAPLSGAGESSADVFAVPGFTDKKFVVKTGPQGEVERIFTPHDTTPMEGLPQPEWVSNFGKIPYDDEAIAALRGNMPREGQGGTRLAVGYENEAGYPRVRKIATNESGRRANAYEADTSEQGYTFEDLPGTRPLSVEAAKVRKPELLAPVIRGADDKFVDMQKLRRVTDKDLVEHFDLGDRRFQDVMSDWLHQGKKLPPGNPKWDAHQAELDQLRKVRPGIGDIEHARQYGFDPNEQLRLLDHGYETPPTATPKATRPSVQRELPHTEKRYNYHATSPANVPGIAESGLDPTKSGANFIWAGERPQTFFAPREGANQARQLVAGIKEVEPSEIRMLRTSRQAEPWSGQRGSVDKMYSRSTPVAADDIEIQNKKGQWVPIRDVLPKGTLPTPPEGLSGDALLKWWGSMLGMAGVSQVRTKSENR